MVEIDEPNCKEDISAECDNEHESNSKSKVWSYKINEGNEEIVNVPTNKLLYDFTVDGGYTAAGMKFFFNNLPNDLAEIIDNSNTKYSSSDLDFLSLNENENTDDILTNFDFS